MWSDGEGEPVRVDVVVLTALEVEYAAVRAHLARPRPVGEERGSLFEVGECGGAGGWRPDDGPGGPLVAIHMTGPGNPAAAVMAERAVALFAPRTVLFVGVAGGRKDVRLGDVVAADSVYDYETGKDTDSGFLPRQKTHQPSYRLVQRARLIAARDRWQRRIHRPLPCAEPRAYVKPIAAGGRVVAHERSETARRLAVGAGDAVAVDMEAYGFLSGAYVNRDVDALVVRGISDLLGDKDEAHDEQWQPVAAGHAAAFAFELIHDLSPAVGAPARAGREARGARDDPSGWEAREQPYGPRPPGGGPDGGLAVAPAPRPGPRRLRTDELGGLAELLLRVPGLTSRERWQQLLDELPAVGTAVNRQPDTHGEALALLRTCEDYRAWADLLAVLAVLSPGAPAVAELGRRMATLGLR
ncbi:hypothetical protein RKE29_09575 [Streptomyces sp. B1866]|uniref:phosphorylase family protein n=1 Tax=Streptomyces sp. B1866 TaxID=3075431 RepID=UPI0028910C26|nr:hypothetical protein [Streptomyces sp. B1866]MDT3396891.1 hypothetical protein [Streptomyces sp. B1866]